MENLEQEKEFIQEKNKFKIDIEAWNRVEANLSDELNQKIKEVISLRNNFNINEDLSSKLDINSELLKEEIEKRNDLKLEIDKLKYKYDSKLQQMKNLKNNLQNEKMNFESKTNDLRLKIKNERNNIEKIQNEIDKKSSEIKNKIMELNKKEKILRDESDKYNHIQNLIKEKNNKNLKNEKDLEIAEYRKNIFYNEIIDKNNEIEEIKDILNKEIKDLENDKLEILNNKNDIDQINREINLRMKCVSDLNDNNFINKFHDIINEMYIKEKKEEINSELLISNNKKDLNDNFKEKEKFDKFKRSSFNSELYLLQLKNRIDTNRIKLNGKYDTTNKKFDHEKEQEYLIKSFESLNKFKK